MFGKGPGGVGGRGRQQRKRPGGGLDVSSRAAYPTDLSDAEWQVLAPLIPMPKAGGRPATHERREIVNALAYWLRAGCAWRLLPHEIGRASCREGGGVEGVAGVV